MSKFKIELNEAGVGELLKSTELGEALQEIGISKVPGEDYSVQKINVGSRVIARINVDTQEALNDNMDNNTLIRALGG